MSVLWVICGAGRGVGKTHVARRLCEVLPDSIRAKCGSGRRQTGKPANFFRTQDELRAFLKARRGAHGHVVVESNAMARERSEDGRGELVVFVAGRVVGGDVRKDAARLRAQADLVVDRDASRRQWNRTLARTVRDAALERIELLGCTGKA